MNIAFVIISLVIISASVAAMSLRNLVHCALALAVALAGLGAAYLELGAQFVGFAQILVYVGAVAILIVFAILLTRGSEAQTQSDSIISPGWLSAAVVTAAVLGILVYAIFNSSLNTPSVPPQPGATVKQIGEALMTKLVLPLEVMALLLTAALIGAVIIAMKDEKK